MTNRVDGNAIAGSLYAAFGREMTMATGTCGNCGRSSRFAELAVYLPGPGAVGRCPHCGNVVVVLVEIRGITCVDVMGFSALQEDVPFTTTRHHDQEGTP